VRRGIFFADGYFPFPVPIVPVWDGETFFEDEIFGVEGQRKRPSADPEVYKLVCGPKTSFPIGPMSREEASWMYWRIKEWDVMEDIAESVSASEGYFGVSPSVPTLTGEVRDGQVTPEWMREEMLITDPFKFIGLTPPNRTWYYDLTTPAPAGSEYLAGWDVDAEMYRRFAVDSPPGFDDPGYPANGGLVATNEFQFRNTIRFVRTEDKEYYGSIDFRGRVYATSTMPSGAPLAGGLTAALGNSAVLYSPTYDHQIIIDVMNWDTESLYQEFLNLPAPDPPQVDVNPLESLNPQIGVEYGSLRRVVYLDETEFSIQFPWRKLTVPLYNRFVQAANFHDVWSGASQTITPPPSVTLGSKTVWPFGGIYS
jgi:hypothetical protein